MKGISRRNRKKERSAEMDFAAIAGVAAAPGKKKGGGTANSNVPPPRQSKADRQQQQQQQQQMEQQDDPNLPKKINHRSNDPKDAAALRTLAAQRNRKGGRSTLLRTQQQQVQQQQQQQQQSSASAATSNNNKASSASSNSSSAVVVPNSGFGGGGGGGGGGGHSSFTPHQRQQRQGDALLDSFRSRLSGSTFRLMNEQLYTTPSGFAQQLLSSESAYKEYHDGYTRQLQLWPVQPVDIILDSFRHSKKGRFDAAFHNMEQRKAGINVSSKNPSAWSGIPLGTAIGDFGCGNAQLAKSLNAVAEQLNAVNQRKAKNKKRKEKKASDATATAAAAGGDNDDDDGGDDKNAPTSFQIHSMDLYAEDPSIITACDMANTPLEDDSLDFAVFSLSLMSTNWLEYLIEAQRTLKKREGYTTQNTSNTTNNNNYFRGGFGGGRSNNPAYGSGNLGSGGILKIVEVRSRLPNPDQFALLVESLGFEFVWGDVVGEGYFSAFDFECVPKSTRRDQEAERNLPMPADVLIPCLYKRR